MTTTIIKSFLYNIYFLLPFFLLIALLIQCSPKTAISELPVKMPDSFSNSGEEPLSSPWWHDFDDPMLDSLITEALDSNLNLLAIWQRFEASQAIVDRESSFLLPDVQASLQYGLSYPQPDFVGGENTRLGMSATYEIDLWGRIRARIHAEEFRAEASFYDYQTAAISLSAEIARTYYQLLAAHSRLQLAEEQIELNKQVLQLIKTRFGVGQIRGVDILRQQQLLESTREQKILSELNMQVLQNQLAVLTGDPPQNGHTINPDSLPSLPPLPATGLPSALLKRRPDVKRDFSNLLAADREVAAAISDKYPRLSISTAASLRSNTINNVFENWAYSISGNLVAPLLYGGRLRAEVDRAKAVRDELLFQYGQTVLTAFREVEDALVREAMQKERIEVLAKQVRLLHKAYGQLRIEYFNGFSDYLAVLTALNQEQQLRRSLISAKYDLIDYRIALYRSLAGGFEDNSGNQNL